jgi:hypothetical protein
MDPRFVVLDPVAEANAIGLRAFQDASFRADAEGIINGQIGRKVGADWFMDQNVPTHTAGTATNAYTVTGVHAAGLKTIVVGGGALGTLLAGDIISFSGPAGHVQTYAVVSTVGGSTITSITFEPGLVIGLAGAETITKRASHTVNLLMHRDAFALAMRPFAGSDPLNLGIFQSAIDPISGLVLRLEVSREHKRTRFAYDVLYGAGVPRPGIAVRIAG